MFICLTSFSENFTSTLCCSTSLLNLFSPCSFFISSVVLLILLLIARVVPCVYCVIFVWSKLVLKIVCELYQSMVAHRRRIGLFLNIIESLIISIGNGEYNISEMVRIVMISKVREW